MRLRAPEIRPEPCRKNSGTVRIPTAGEACEFVRSLASFHDVGKFTIGFQHKAPAFAPHDTFFADQPKSTSDERLIVVPRPEGRPFVVYVLPANDLTGRNAVRSLPVGARTPVIVLDLELHTEPHPALIRDLLGLTLAKARVAAPVGTGTTPREASERLGITENTVRQTLKSVFAKTGVNRQTELALLLSRMALA